MVLINIGGSEVFTADLAGNAANEFGLLGSKDSVDYLFDNSLATTDLSLNRDTTMSFEFQFILDPTENDAFLGLFDNGIEFHLSPERRGSAPVPEPATMFLFGTGLIGLAGGMRRKIAKT